MTQPYRLLESHDESFSSGPGQCESRLDSFLFIASKEYTPDERVTEIQLRKQTKKHVTDLQLATYSFAEFYIFIHLFCWQEQNGDKD